MKLSFILTSKIDRIFMQIGIRETDNRKAAKRWRVTPPSGCLSFDYKFFSI